ncbi:hypothetical protein [Brucella pseudogrignonensis]|jgi:hypothetical protein|uniref:hypothetical protein n=1 Tax=Brucella pseudogrignonensis TaxID=419475 RepID=UPI0002BBB840|nr:hypothetical protein [Brucella pseudogrignonensis]EMG51579.1 hypothetical protein WYI_21590 [Ochrobactrum sp. CDB2]MQP42448.1 hypothetical protein [Ochrobactrum sp. MYb237]PQZ39240.1 hypothetical protein CQ059_21765 [Brucella pseudogrignonensis]PRA35880.1 hypothetical protein CQ063_22610 [Brucella pseudogrignonensis]PRA62952.1 hypothetical protein CQ055_20945 [Brucella pseudogrignonensis]
MNAEKQTPAGVRKFRSALDRSNRHDDLMVHAVTAIANIDGFVADELAKRPFSRRTACEPACFRVKPSRCLRNQVRLEKILCQSDLAQRKFR